MGKSMGSSTWNSRDNSMGNRDSMDRALINFIQIIIDSSVRMYNL